MTEAEEYKGHASLWVSRQEEWETVGGRRDSGREKCREVERGTDMKAGNKD